MIKAVLWDFGGVITSSPFEAFNRLEEERGLPRDFIRMINAKNPDTNAWALFERSEISAADFDEAFSKEADGKVRGAEVIKCLGGTVRPEMVEALTRIKARHKTACITNNVKAGEGAGMVRDAETAQAIAKIMDELFDHVIESSKAGVRKPDPRIYEMACEAIGVDPADCIYLDDLGINLKPARAMGMATIKVTGADQALDELEALVGFSLRG